MPIIGDFKVRIGADMSQFRKTFKEIERGLSGLRSRVESFGKIATTRVTLPLLAMAGAALKVSGDFEQTSRAFETIIGDTQVAKRVLSDLYRFAESTPLQFGSEIAPAARKLLAFGVAADDVVGTLRRIGDISAGVGQPVGEIAEIFGKARVQGRLFAEDINQLTGRGIPVIQEFAKQFGVTQDKVRQLVFEGKIGFPQLEKAFQSLTSEGGAFFNLTQVQSETLLGKFSTFKDNMAGLLRAIGDALQSTFDVKGLLDSATSGIKRVSDFVRKLAEERPGLLKVGLAIAAIAAGIGPLALAVSGLLAILPALTTGFLALKAAMTGVFGIVGLLTTAAVVLVANWEKVKAFFQDLWEKVVSVFRVSVELIKAMLHGMWVGVQARFLEGVAAILDPMRKLLEFLGADALLEKVGAAQEAMRNIVPADAVSTATERIRSLRRELSGLFAGRENVSGSPSSAISSSPTLSTILTGSGGRGAAAASSLAIDTLQSVPLAARPASRSMLELASSVRTVGEAVDGAAVKLRGLTVGIATATPAAIDGLALAAGNAFVKLLSLRDGFASVTDAVKTLRDGARQVFRQIIRDITVAVAKAAILRGLLRLAGGGTGIVPTILRSVAGGVPGLARGGVAFGPSLAIVGDNPGARSDPEVIAPLSKLKSMMGRSGPATLRVQPGELRWDGLALVATVRAALEMEKQMGGSGEL